MQLNPFTQSDRWAFAGCEDASPEINYQDFGVTILDGKTIQVFYTTGFGQKEAQDGSGDLSDSFYMLTLPSKAAAKAVTAALPEVLTHEFLIEFGFTHS